MALGLSNRLLVMDRPRYRELPDGTILIDDHFPDCTYPADLTRWREALAHFEASYPRYCRTCDGTGVIVSTYDPSPAGVALGSGFMTDIEPCAACEAENRCGLCGADWTALLDAEALAVLVESDPEFPRPCGCPRGVESPGALEFYCGCSERLLDALDAKER